MTAVTRGPRELLRGQRHLPEDLRQSVVLLVFREPVPRYVVSEFLRIHLQRVQLERGEQDSYMANVFQPHRVGPKPCPKCGNIMRPVSEAWSVCECAGCEIFRRRVMHGPLIGVINVLTWTDSVVGHTATGEELVKNCGLVLDRRYDETTLAAVYRTAEALAEHLGRNLENPA
jgi:hypothetical protein